MTETVSRQEGEKSQLLIHKLVIRDHKTDLVHGDEWACSLIEVFSCACYFKFTYEDGKVTPTQLLHKPEP